MSVTEYTTQFLNLHGLLQTGSELNKAEIMVKNLTSTLTALAATESFSCHRLLQMLAINFYSLKEATENFSEDQLSIDEKRIKNLVLDLIAGFFNAFLLPVYTLQSSNLLEYHSLPASKFTFQNYIYCSFVSVQYLVNLFLLRYKAMFSRVIFQTAEFRIYLTL